MGDRMKRWFRRKTKDKSKDPYPRDKRSLSSPRSLESTSRSSTLPRPQIRSSTQGHISRSRSRTPDGSIHDYYLETNPDPYPVMQNGPRSRSEPRFRAANMDPKLRARDHGYYIKAAGLSERESNKENVRLIYDRSHMTSPNRSGNVTGHTSRYTSRFGSRNESSSSSFRENKPRIYRPNKRPAPNPPAAVYSRQHSHESHGSNGDVALKVIRKKKRAPPPPTLQRTWSQQNVVAESPRQSMVQTDVYPIEPPIDYDKVHKIETTEEDDHKVVPPIPPPPPPPPIGGIPKPKSDSPVPPPLPPKPDVTDNTRSGQGQPVARVNTLLRKDIITAAKARSKRGPVEPAESQYRDSFMKFANELTEAVETRNKRRGFGTLRMRHISRSKMFKARPSKADMSADLPTTVDDMIERAQEEAVERRASDDERRKLRHSARVDTHEWTPEQDLDDVFETQGQPTREITARGSDYYDINSLIDGNHDIGKTDSVLYKKAKYAKPNKRNKRSNLERLKKSIGKAFGSIGKSLNKKGGEVEHLYPEEEGWQIQYNKKVDAPPTGPISVKRIEKYPAYAYHPDKGQLVLLPDYDRIIITEDGKRIREADLAKLNKNMPVFGQAKPRPALEGVFDTGGVTQITHAQTVPPIDYERQDLELMEAQFEQVRLINKKETGQVLDTGIEKPWRSTPDLTNDLYENGYPNDGVLSDDDHPMLTLSMREDDVMRGKKKKRSLKKSKSKKSSSSSDGKSPRQKVLRKGLDYYFNQRSPSRNPVFSSDDEDEGLVQSDPNSESSTTKPVKADSLGDSGIGQESLNSSASTSSMPIPASFMQAGVDAKGQPLYYATPAHPVVNHSVAPHPVVMTPSYSMATPFLYHPMYYPNQLNHMHPPAMTTGHPFAMPTHHVTSQPIDFQNQSHLSTDSSSTLVATDLNTTTLNASKNSSKVINVSDNIALVSYNKSSDTGNAPTPTNTSEADLQETLRKQYLVGPVGYRPVRFNPNARAKPVTLPERTFSFNAKQTRPVPYPFADRRSQSSNELLLGNHSLDPALQLLNGPVSNTGDKVVLNSTSGHLNKVAMDSDYATKQVLNNKPPSALSSMSSYGASSVITTVTSDTLTASSEPQPEQSKRSSVDADVTQGDSNNNATTDKHDTAAEAPDDATSLQSNIPTDVIRAYGHENLVAL